MCDCAVAVGSATRRGGVVFGKNSDRERDEAQVVRSVPRAEHRRGASLRCSSLSLPQVRETHAILGSGPFWCWGLEQGVNDCGVAIGNESVFTHEELELPSEGLLGMDLVRLGLERARSAAEAVRILGELIERHGQGGRGFLHLDLAYSNGFLIADATEAWTLQTSARRWAARRVREVEAISNQLSIGSDWELASPDLEGFAIERGWWDAGRGRVDFSSAYRSTRIFAAAASEGRLRRAHTLLESARGHIDAETLWALLRDHGEGCTVPRAAERTDEAYFTLCAHNDIQQETAASLVVESDRPPVWLALAAPCCSVYLPLSVGEPLPQALTCAGEQPSADSAWWQLRELQWAVQADFAKRLPRVRDAFAPLEQVWRRAAIDGQALPSAAEATAQALEVTARLSRELAAL
ncbi:MAG: C69 family dipeptidase [Myxococcota bacterium]